MYKKFISITGFVLFFIFCKAEVNVPEKIIGNWINEKTNNWDYGFYEKFAIYDCDFWEYKSVSNEKKYISITLQKEKRQISLKLFINKDSLVSITQGNETAVKYKRHRPRLFYYADPDLKTFKHSGINPDTVKITGYYHTLNRNLQATIQKRFTVKVYDFIREKKESYSADFDSLGRFTIRFPVLSTQQIATDWGTLVVEPGEKIFLFGDYTQKNVVFMGANARLHHEIFNYPSLSSNAIAKAYHNNFTDLEFYNVVKKHYDERESQLAAYIKTYPTVSSRFKEYQHALNKYDLDGLACSLMNYRNEIKKQGRNAFDSGYMESLQKNISIRDEKYPLLISQFGDFIGEYLTYHKRLNDRNNFSFIAEAMGQLKNSSLLNEKEKQIISEGQNILYQLSQIPEKDSVQRSSFLKEHQELGKRTQSLMRNSQIKNAFDLIVEEKQLRKDIESYDFLLPNKALKELLIARRLYRSMDKKLQPLSDHSLVVLEETITDPVIKKIVLTTHHGYANINAKKISDNASLKNVEHLKELKDPDTLFRQLIGPYKGKVIYLDFWGTWCQPCREHMQFAVSIKKQFTGKDVIFMYLANKSPETVWKNVITQLGLTGENVVHYNLPANQQALLEKKFAVQYYPTYMLVNKEGNVVNDKAPYPDKPELLIPAIQRLLEE